MKSTLFARFGLSSMILFGALASSACQTPAKAPGPVASAQKADPRYAKLPEPGPRKAWAPPPAKKLAMPNGQTLWLLERPNTPLVTLEVILPRGSATDPVGKAGLTRITADLLDEGAGPMGALELSEAFDLISTDYSAEVTTDATLLTLNGLSESFERALELLQYILKAPALAESEFQRRKQQHLAEALSRKDEPGQLLKEQLHRQVFGEGYLGLPTEGTEATLEAIQLADVRKHAAGLIAAEGAHFVVVGPLSEARAMRLFSRFFSDWKGKSTLTNRTLAAHTPSPNVQIVPFPGAAQTALGVAKRAGNALAPEYYRELVMNERLGGSFTSRINLNLREDKGYTYGAVSLFQRYREAGLFAVMANVQAQATGPSLVEIFNELGAICGDRPLSAAERNEAVDGLLLGYPLRFESTHAIAAQLATLPLFDRPLDFYQAWPSRIDAVTVADAQASTAPYCRREDFDVVLVGDPEVILPQLEKIGAPSQIVKMPEAAPPPKVSAPAKNPKK